METKSIYVKLLDFQTNIETIKKDGQNTFFKKPDGKASTYATLPNILAEVKPLLNVLKIVVTQPIIDGFVTTILTDSETCESVKSSILIPTGLNAQQCGSAITYFRRYTLCSLLSLEIDEDDDGNKASQTVSDKKDKPETVWLTEEQFNSAMKADKKGILATLNAFNGKSGKSMKKDYSTKLTEQLKTAN